MLKRSAAWSRGLWWVVGGIAVVVVVFAIAWVLFVPIADWLATHDVGSVTGPLRTLRLQTARDAARGRLLTLGAGLFAAGALVFTASNYLLARQGQVTDRYTKAIDQLGSKKLDVRIGGIYALERIARDSSRDHPTVLEVLSAFVREHSREQPPGPAQDQPSANRDVNRTHADVQSAVTVIGHLNPRRDRQPVDLSGAILRDASLKEANLTLVNLTRADFRGGNLFGADLTKADLYFARLSHADLQVGNLTSAWLVHADLRGAQLYHANLTGANLSGADLNDADLRNVRHCKNAYFNGADLTGAKLAGADLSDADLSDTCWPSDAVIPEGWERDTDSGRLSRSGAEPPKSATNAPR